MMHTAFVSEKGKQEVIKPRGNFVADGGALGRGSIKIVVIEDFPDNVTVYSDGSVVRR